MNIQFTPIKTLKINGTRYILKRADVTRSKSFWAAWNNASKIEREALSLNVRPPQTIKNLVSITNHPQYGIPRWFAYALIPEHSPVPVKPPSQYTLRSSRGLLSYQIPAVEALCASVISHNAAADSSETGIGKTYHALAAARELSIRPAILCRTSGFSAWEDAAVHLYISPLFITTWEKAKGKNFQYTKRMKYDNRYYYKWQLPKNVILIFDEAHVGNNYPSQNYCLWTSARKQGIPTLSLSATFADRPERLQALFEVLGILDRKKYMEWFYSLGAYNDSYDNIQCIDSTGIMKVINSILYPSYGVRISYNDPAVKKFFPSLICHTEKIFIGTEQIKKHNHYFYALKEKIIDLKEKGVSGQAFTLELRFRQITELLKAPAIAERAKTYIEQGHSVIIFVNYVDTLSWLAKRLHTRSLIFGDMENHGLNIKDVQKRFQENKVPLLISTIGAGGQSISLHDIKGHSPRISLICPTYEAIKLKQVLGRAYRAKSKSTPIMKLVYAGGTVEEKVAHAVNSKIDNIMALNDGDLMEPDLFGLTEREK